MKLNFSIITLVLVFFAGIAQASDKPKTYIQYIYINGVVIAQVLPVLPETRTPEQIKRAKELKAQFLEREEPAHAYMRERGMFDNK